MSSTSCGDGTLDTTLPVLAPDGSGVINGYGGLSTLSDEHITVFPPGSIPQHPDYVLFVAARTNLQPDASGVVVLSGGTGPDQNGQWTLDFAPDFGAYDPSGAAGSQNGQLFETAMEHSACPMLNGASDPDPTFDLNYADPGTVLLDPTNRDNSGPGSFLMIYEGTNRCIGRHTDSNKGNNFYSTIGVATSLDQGHTWPDYASNWLFPGLPGVNPVAGPHADFGATGASVYMGNDQNTVAPANYGRYAVLGPVVGVKEAMNRTQGDLLNNVGDSEPAAFVDDVHGYDGGPSPYIYVVHNYAPGQFSGNGPKDNTPLPQGEQSDITIGRGQLNGGTAPLSFENWYQGAFGDAGMGRDGGGHESPIFPVDSSLYQQCLSPDQGRSMGSISYVEDTQQYLLVFVCASPTDPQYTKSDPGGGQHGAAWFYSTMDAHQYDLSHQEQWSIPQEVTGSWSQFAGTPGGQGCVRNFNGWYPTFMSLHHKAAHLTTSGFVFYLNGCTDTDTPGGRQFSTRAFTISTK